MEKNHVRKYLSRPDIHKSNIYEGIHPQFLREFADVIERKVNFIPIFRQGNEEDPGAIDCSASVPLRAFRGQTKPKLHFQACKEDNYQE